MVDVLHPAHVHFFRNFIAEMQSRQHEFLITARDKECTIDLLRAYNLPHVVISRQSRGLGLGPELVLRTAKLWRLARRFRADFLLGIMGPSIALAGRALTARTVIFYDTEMARITNWFAYPLADFVCTSSCYQEDVGDHHIRYDGYHELAYLHPNRFVPDIKILTKHQLDSERPIYLLRFVSWEASHDVGEQGFSLAAKRRLVSILSRRGQVLISSESALPEDLEPYRFRFPVQDIHHVIAFADLLVGESATMASEAAVLGTHALFVSRTGRGYTDEQQQRYGLVHCFADTQGKEALAEVERLMGKVDLKLDAEKRRRRLLEEKTDVTQWMVEFFEDRGQELT